jgi:hypothetical protein
MCRDEPCSNSGSLRTAAAQTAQHQAACLHEAQHTKCRCRVAVHAIALERVWHNLRQAHTQLPNTHQAWTGSYHHSGKVMQGAHQRWEGPYSACIEAWMLYAQQCKHTAGLRLTCCCSIPSPPVLRWGVNHGDACAVGTAGGVGQQADMASRGRVH